MRIPHSATRRRFIALSASTALATPFILSPAFAATDPDADMISRRKINLAGRQRMLSQRISRAALFNSLDIEPERHLTMLKESHRLFDRTLTALKSGDDELELPGERISTVIDTLNQVQGVWAGFSLIVQRIIERESVSDQDVETVAVLNTDVLARSNDVVERMVDEYGNNDIEVGLAVSINLAGRQRMLSQKIAKEAALVGLGYNVEENAAILQKTTGLFGATLTALMDGLPTFTLPAPPPHIREKLTEVAGLWEGYKTVVDRVAESKAADVWSLNTIASTADPLLTTMNDAVTLYEQL